LPDWAQQLLDQPMTPLHSRLVRGGVQGIAPIIRWAVRSGSLHRSRIRMGLPPY